MCNCAKKGFAHWWKYLKLRYYWRNFWESLRYEERTIDGKSYWVDRTSTTVQTEIGVVLVPVERLFNKYPGPSMSLDEYKHWFPSIKRGALPQKSQLPQKCLKI